MSDESDTPFFRMVIPVLMLIGCLTIPLSCGRTVDIRVRNDSSYEFDRVHLEGHELGPLAPGDTSHYVQVKLGPVVQYADLELGIDGRKLTGSTMNFNARRFTHGIDVKDLEKGHLDIDVIREESEAE